MEKPLRDLLQMVGIHFAEDEQILSEPNGYTYSDGDHEELVQLLIRHLYANRDAFLLLLKKSQGTAFENCIDEVVGKIEKGYQVMAGAYGRKNARNAGEFLYAALDDSYEH